MLGRRNCPQNWMGNCPFDRLNTQVISLLVGHGVCISERNVNEKSHDASPMQSPMCLIAPQGLLRPILWSGRFRIKNNGEVESWI